VSDILEMIEISEQEQPSQHRLKHNKQFDVVEHRDHILERAVEETKTSQIKILSNHLPQSS
jgi:hypothetical protein